MFFSFFISQGYASLNGLEFSSDGKILMSAPSELVSVEIPAKCEIINGGDSPIKSSFFQCINRITCVSFQAGSQLNCIYPYVFANSSLESIDLHHCSHLYSLNYSVFRCCEKLSSVLLPEGMIVIMSGSFWGDISLESIAIPDTVEIIEGWHPIHLGAFERCTNLREVKLTENSNFRQASVDAFLKTSLESFYIPKFTTNIANAIYYTKLTTIEIHPENTNFKFDGTSLTSYDGEILLLLITREEMEYNVPSSIVEFGDSSCRMSKVTKIIFNGEIRKFGIGVFAGSRLRSFEFPLGTSNVPYYFFKDITTLVSVTLTSDITLIYARAFENCISLSEINNANNLIEIKEDAFYNCTSLKTFVVPASLTIYGSPHDNSPKEGLSVFHGCKIPNFDVSHNNLYSKDNQGLVYFKEYAVEFFGDSSEIEIPSTCTKIATNVFYDHLLTKITFRSNLVQINNQAFRNTKLSILTLPSSMTTLGTKSFYDVSTLTAVDMENSQITAIPDMCFFGCTNLRSVKLPIHLKHIGASAFQLCDLTETFSIYFTDITSIGKQAFSETKITSISFPQTLETIGEKIFSNSSIVSIDISNCKIKIIEEGAFLDCVSFKTISFCYSVTHINSLAFCNCYSLTNVFFPHDIEYIRPKAFYNCRNLIYFNLTLNCNLKNIDGQAFKGCYNLKDVGIDKYDVKFSVEDGVLMDYKKEVLKLFLPGSETIIFILPSTIIEIANYAFQDCVNLRTVAIPIGSTTIGYHAFEGCTSLSSLYLPYTLKSFGINAFIKCFNLKCGSVSFPKGDLDLAIEAGIPEIAFQTKCPTFVCRTCKNNQIFCDSLSFLLCIFVIQSE